MQQMPGVGGPMGPPMGPAPMGPAGGDAKPFKIGGGCALALGVVTLVLSVVMFVYSAKNHGAADRLESSSEVGRAGSLGKIIVRAVRKKADRQGTQGILLLVLSLVTVGGGVALLVIAKKKGSAPGPMMAGPGGPPMGGPPMGGPPMGGPPMGGPPMGGPPMGGPPPGFG